MGTVKIIELDNKKLREIEKQINDTLSDKYITPIGKRVKNSKFKKLIETFSDEEIKILGYCLLGNTKLKEAIDVYSKAVENGVQLYALKLEIENRSKIEKQNNLLSN